MDAVISAGGKGTRLGNLTRDIPKCLIPIGLKPILRLQLEELARNGIRKAWMLTGHLGEIVDEYLASGKTPIEVQTIRESMPLGTGGGLAELRGKITDDFLFVYGDLVFSLDLERMKARHNEAHSVVTLLAHPNSHPFDSDLIQADADGKVTAILGKKSPRSGYHRNLVNAGVYIVSPRVIGLVPPNEKHDFEKDILPPLVAAGEVGCYRTCEYVKDMGTLDRLDRVAKDLGDGFVESRRLNNPQRAIFFDRDGTLNKYVGLLSKPDDLELLPGAAEAVRLGNEKGYLCFVVTNQPVVARGLCTFEEEDEINGKLETLLGAEGAFLDDFRYCPHHPNGGYPGEIASLKIDCGCRKPKTGMLDELAKKYNIDLSRSWLIGDTSSDIQTAKNAGMRSVLVSCGMPEPQRKYQATPEGAASDALEAVRFVLSSYGAEIVGESIA